MTVNDSCYELEDDRVKVEELGSKELILSTCSYQSNLRFVIFTEKQE